MLELTEHYHCGSQTLYSELESKYQRDNLHFLICGEGGEVRG
jgi:hypothetical protein